MNYKKAKKSLVKIFDSSTNNTENSDISIESVFGLWKDGNITKESLRKIAWAKTFIK